MFDIIRLKILQNSSAIKKSSVTLCHIGLQAQSLQHLGSHPQPQLSQIGQERRGGYSWYGIQPSRLFPLYEKWKNEGF